MHHDTDHTDHLDTDDNFFTLAVLGPSGSDALNFLVDTKLARHEDLWCQLERARASVLLAEAWGVECARFEGLESALSHRDEVARSELNQLIVANALHQRDAAYFARTMSCLLRASSALDSIETVVVEFETVSARVHARAKMARFRLFLHAPSVRSLCSDALSVVYAFA